MIEISDLTHPETAELLASLEPDIMVVSCFPRLIPAALRSIPRLAAINLHPSPLPQLRGPDPLFWTFRFGLRQSGVTIHLLCDTFDTGPILLRQPFDVPIGIPGDDLERHVAAIGGDLLVRAVGDLAGGRARYIAQDEQYASYQTWPDARDLVVDPRWDADTVWSFVRGILPLGYMPTVRVGGRDYAIDQAIRFIPTPAWGRSEVIEDGVLTLFRENGIVELGIQPLEHGKDD